MTIRGAKVFNGAVGFLTGGNCRFRWRGAPVALLAALIALAGPPFAPAQEEEEEQQPTVDVNLFYPPDMTLVEKYDIPIEGMMLSVADEFHVVVNDNKPMRILVRDRVFADEIQLDEGLNKIKIGAILRHVWLAPPGSKTKPPPEYQKVYGHFGLNDGCLECHKLDKNSMFKLAGEREEICGWCHGDLIWGTTRAPLASVHVPVREGRCLICHEVHNSTKKGLPVANQPECISCHKMIVERLKSDRFSHGPMNLGDCRICHTVHSSSEPKLLARRATSLCTDCHSDTLLVPTTPGAVKPHTMISEGKCGRCHEPHSSVNLLLLRQPAGRLCQECHEGKTRSFHEAKGFSIYICAKCHELHRPTQPHLIIEAARSLCTECHSFPGEAVFTHSFVEEGKCFLCHSFHEAPLSGEISALCLGCHRDNQRLPKAHHRVSFETSRCTNCHLPHKSAQKKLLRVNEHTPFKQRQCDLCHRDRAAEIGPVYQPLCTGCHRTKSMAAAAAAKTAAVVHPPFKSKDCSSCHRSHNSDPPNLLREDEGELCLNCHRKMRKSMLMTPVSSHSDVIKGRCGSCHDPHWSVNQTLLHKPQSELCRSCHEDVVQAPGGGPWPVPHKPVEEGKCRLCHREHVSSYKKLLKLPAAQSCRPCHTQFFAATEAAGIGSRHAPFRKGECGACHQLHGSDAAKFLKPGANDAICRNCHGKLGINAHHKAAAAQNPGYGKISGGGCLYCHLPHAAAERRLLLPPEGPVCQSCHKV